MLYRNEIMKNMDSDTRNELLRLEKKLEEKQEIKLKN